MYFCYQGDKIKKGGMLPAVGPCVVSARCACEAWLNSTPYLFTGHESNGLLYVEDSGTTILSGYQATLTATASTQGDGKAASGTDVSITPLVRTRKMYPAGIHNDAREERIFLLFSAYGSAITASATTVANSTAVVSSGSFGSVVPGMLVTGSAIDGGTIVLSKSDNSNIVLSRAANASGTGTLTFDSGAIAMTVRGSGIREAVVGCDTQYDTTRIGDLLVVHNDNMRQGLELQIEKVPLTFDSNHDTATWADLGVNMRLHQFTMLVNNEGTEMNRAS
jgi:hypothetical protein